MNIFIWFNEKPTAKLSNTIVAKKEEETSYIFICNFFTLQNNNFLKLETFFARLEKYQTS